MLQTINENIVYEADSILSKEPSKVKTLMRHQRDVVRSRKPIHSPE
jgi:hypothetical protein